MHLMRLLSLVLKGRSIRQTNDDRSEADGKCRIEIKCISPTIEARYGLLVKNARKAGRIKTSA